MFDRFYRAPGSSGTEGSGLGLSIARWIVGVHSGEIIVESAQGTGTTFTVLLPAVAEQPVRFAREELPCAGHWLAIGWLLPGYCLATAWLLPGY